MMIAEVQMSRSVHTRPRRVLAPARVIAPHEPRGAGDRSARYVAARELKEHGLVCEARVSVLVERVTPLPRVIVRQPGPGRSHPADRRDVLRVLRFFGAEYTYGLRAVELRPAPPDVAVGRLRFGSLRVPGHIRLYDQPPPPWLLPGTLSARERARLEQAGALVERAMAGGATRVEWPGTTLRDFMLFDVLMHEIGHHMVQQYTGKRRARVLRTKDHEAFADRLAARCRTTFLDGDGAPL
jgi:hypothetical protein